MILTSEQIDVAEFERRTGWAIKPQGACKGEMCVPLFTTEPTVDLVAERLGMPVVRDEARGLIALGPDIVSGKALATADMPDITLTDLDGEQVPLRSLKGQKIFLLAWASW